MTETGRLRDVRSWVFFRKERILWPGSAVLAAVLVLAYAPALQGDFVFDDVFFIKENPVIRDLSNTPAVFLSSFWEASSQPTGAYYRPVVVVSYAVNFALGAYEPFGYHLLNVLLHLASTLLLLSLTYFLCRHAGAALIAGLLYGLHPVNTEAVAWISGRTDLLSTLFFLSALTFYVRWNPPWSVTLEASDQGPGRSRVFLSCGLLSFLLALLSKESAASLPAVLVVYELAFRRLRAAAMLRILPFVVLLGIFLAWRQAVLGEIHVGQVEFVANPLVEEGLSARVFTGLIVFAKYLQLLVFPAWLSVDYSFDQIPVARNLSDLRVLVSAIVVGGLLLLVWRCWKRNALAFFGIGFFLTTGALIFANAIFPFSILVAERFMYLPCAGLCVAVVGIATRGFEERESRIWRIGVASIACLVSVAFFVRTLDRAADWRDELTLFRTATEVSPNSTIAHFGLANAHYALGNIERAAVSYDAALRIHPQYSGAVAGMGSVALARGDDAEAIRYLSRAASLGAEDDEIYSSLGAAYARSGQLGKALRATEVALRLNPKSSQAHNNLGNIHLLEGDPEKALASWHEAARLNPFNEQTLNNLGYVYEQIGDRENAAKYYARFLEVAPESMAPRKEQIRVKLKAMQASASPSPSGSDQTPAR